MVEQALADGHGITGPLGHDRADRANMRRLVGEHQPGVAKLARRRIDDQMRGAPSPRQAEHVLAVDVPARAHAQLAHDAAVALQNDIRVRRIDPAAGIIVRIMRVEHFKLVAQRLELAIAALGAAGAEVIALDE